MKSALILYPHQLFPLDQLPQVDAILMVEDPLYFGIDRELPIKLHKQKLILHRASMRRYVEEVLWPADIEVDYVSLDGLMTSEDIFERARKFEQLYLFDPVDDVITKRLLEARRSDTSVPSFEFLPSPNFYLKNQEVQGYFADKHMHIFEDFYQWQRERFNILIGEDYKPVGGKWIIEDEKYAGDSDEPLPSFEVFGSNKYVAEATKFMQEHFPDNPGDIDFVWPTNHAEAEAWLDSFIENRLEGYSKYQNRIDSKALWLHHSAISASLNVGLLSPQQVVSRALAHHAKKPINLASLESFIRGVLGWREFIRGLYLLNGRTMRSNNSLKHQRRLTEEWYTGSLGVPLFDNVVAKLLSHGYANQNERQLIVGGLMIMCEIHPGDIHHWFSKLGIDAYDWVTTPNVFALSQFLEDQAVINDPPICPSSTIIEASDYERGLWSDIWDGLYWRFVEKHASVFKQTPSMRSAVQRLERLDPDHRRIVGYRAEDFLNKFTR